jgi:hypothetical protein
MKAATLQQHCLTAPTRSKTRFLPFVLRQTRPFAVQQLFCANPYVAHRFCYRNCQRLYGSSDERPKRLDCLILARELGAPMDSHPAAGRAFSSHEYLGTH